MSSKSSTYESASVTQNPSNAGMCDGPEMPAPVKQHEWLQRFVGEWDADVEAYMAPGQPPMQTKGVSRARMLGGFWLIEEGQNTMMPYAFILTLGFDPQKKKYVGTWIDTMMGHLWKYEGTVDSTGKILTLDTEGPNPMEDGKIGKVREVTEFKNDDLRVLTSTRLADDGTSTKIMTVTLRRKR
jgi:hypothetical protein